MTYNVFGGTLNLTQSQSRWSSYIAPKPCKGAQNAKQLLSE